MLSTDGMEVLQNGTPVRIIGEYDYAGARPWIKPEWWIQPISLPDDICFVTRTSRLAPPNGNRGRKEE
jgi:hypothetical protein